MRIRNRALGAAFCTAGLIAGTAYVWPAVRPPPRTAELLARVRRAWAANPVHEGYVGVMLPQSDLPRSAYHYVDEQGRSILGVSDMSGLRHLERMSGGQEWEYYQYGLETLYQVRLLEPPPGRFVQWRLSGFPLPREIVEHLAATEATIGKAARGARVLGRARARRGWQIQIALPAPAPTRELPGAAYDFDRDVLGRPWTVSVDERTWLPVALTAGEPGMRPYQARWRSMTDAERSRRIAWIRRDGAGEPTSRIRKTMMLQARAGDAGSLNRARDRIRADVVAWQTAASRSSLSELMRP